jgi:hypothetical protein
MLMTMLPMVIGIPSNATARISRAEAMASPEAALQQRAMPADDVQQ